MAKKTTLILILSLLLIASFSFVACSQDAGGNAGGGGGGGNKPTPPSKKEDVKNELGDMKDLINYVFDDDAPYKQLTGDGSALTFAEDEGIDGSDALLVEQNYNYGQVAIDMTKFYGRGKSYYVEAWFKAADVEGARMDLQCCAKIDFSIITGAGYNYYPDHQTWDIPGQYDGAMLDNDTAYDVFEIETNLLDEGAYLGDGEWHMVCGILDAENIEKVITSMDEQCHATGESSLYEFNIILLVGTYEEDETAGQKGYKYYLDNVKIVDLNDEIDIEGKTYEDPEADGDGDGDGDGV